MNHPLARALRGIGLESVDVAARLGVDPKTVGRWLAGRIPYPRHRAALAQLTGWAAGELWPNLVRPAPLSPSANEVRVIYPHRSVVPVDAWRRLFAGAEREISVLAYSALFLIEDTGTERLLREKARAGVRVRIALGDPSGRQVAQRGVDEGIDDVMVGRVRNALILYERLADEVGIELRLHDTVLYSSIYRADDELLINPHVYGRAASHAPVLHLMWTRPHGMTATYVASFERVWDSARRFGRR